ncbi:50S ribosomal protein L20 [bacterium]|nr:50S ribosomal protein L20 [bacterium]
MTRVKTGITRRKRHHKVRKLTKGYRGSSSRRHGTGVEAILHAGKYAYRDRRARKRMFRRIWISRLGAALRSMNLGSYSAFQKDLHDANVRLNRKMLSEIAVRDEALFGKIVSEVRGS